MKHERLHALTDGIFAISMTLLVLDLKIPEVADNISAAGLWAELYKLWPVFFSFALSFTLLYGYWRAHNLITSTYMKNLDTKLVNLNIIFLFFVSLVPFSTNLLGRFIGNRAGLIIYGINIGALGLTLWNARRYADKSEHIDTSDNGWTRRDRRNSSIRAFGPIVIAVIAVVVSSYSGGLALAILTLSVVLNLTRTGYDLLYTLLDRLGIGTNE